MAALKYWVWLTALPGLSNRSRLLLLERYGLSLIHILSASAVLPDCRTGTYLYICGPDGDMALAVNDMAVYDSMTPDFLRQRLDFINGADLVVRIVCDYL